ncbi:hypothetical protein EV121DRAFT_273922 [Schizophyllum commune]
MADASPPAAKIPRTKSPSPPITDAASGPSNAPTATVSAAQQFSNEIWGEIMSHCSVYDLFCLRDTVHLFRTMIDMDMLTDAFWDAHLYLAVPSNSDRALLPANLRHNLGFMKAICVGPCSVCGTWTALPPAAGDLKIRLCGSEDCSSYMFSRHMTRGWTPSAPRHVTYATYGSERDVEFHLPEVAEAWMPRMLMDTTRYLRKQHIHELFFQSREGDNCRMLLESRLMAKRELDAVGWEKGDDDDIVRNSKDKEGAKLLESIYDLRVRRYAVTHDIYTMLVYWRVSEEKENPNLRQKNLEVVRERAKSLGYNPYGTANNAFIQRVLEAHMRDMSTILLPAANCLFPLPDLPKGPWSDFERPEESWKVRRLRFFGRFKDQEEHSVDNAREDPDAVKVGSPAPALTPKPALALEPASAPDPEVDVIASRSDSNDDSDRTPGDNHTPSGSARKNAPGRSSKARAKARRTKQANSDPKAWYTCTLCESETRKYESQDELEEHIAKGHPSASAFTVS